MKIASKFSDAPIVGIRGAVRYACSGLGAKMALAFCAVLLLSLSMSHAPVAARTPVETANRVAQDVLSDSRYQRDLPSGQKVEVSPAPRQEPVPRLEEPEPPVVTDAGAAMDIGLWIIVFIAVVLIVLFLIEDLTGRRFLRNRPAEPETRVTDAEPDEEVVLLSVGPLEDADRLAAQGRFDDAVHVLLLGALESIRLSIGRVFEPSLTSRELVAKDFMPAPYRRLVATLVSAVETSRFAGHPAGESEFRRCRGIYTQLPSRTEEPA